MLRMGDQEGEIIAHGTDTNPRSGIPYVWVTIRLDSGDEETARISLASDKDPDSDATTKRMARQALRLCGFDVDVADLDMLDHDQHLLVGNRVPVNVSKSKDGKYTNVNIQRRRGMEKDEKKKLTDLLRAHKSKDEERFPPPQPPGTTPVPQGAFPGGARTIDAKDIPTSGKRDPLEGMPAPDDVPFAWIGVLLIAGLSAVGLA